MNVCSFSKIFPFLNLFSPYLIRLNGWPRSHFKKSSSDANKNVSVCVEFDLLSVLALFISSPAIMCQGHRVPRPLSTRLYARAGGLHQTDGHADKTDRDRQAAGLAQTDRHTCRQTNRCAAGLHQRLCPTPVVPRTFCQETVKVIWVMWYGSNFGFPKYTVSLIGQLCSHITSRMKVYNILV